MFFFFFLSISVIICQTKKVASLGKTLPYKYRRISYQFMHFLSPLMVASTNIKEILTLIPSSFFLNDFYTSNLSNKFDHVTKTKHGYFGLFRYL